MSENLTDKLMRIKDDIVKSFTGEGGILGSVRGKVQKKIDENKQNDKYASNTDAKNTKFNEGEIGPIMGLRKKLAISVIGVAALVFVAAFWFAFSSGKSDKKETERPRNMEIADENQVSSAMQGSNSSQLAALRANNNPNANAAAQQRNQQRAQERPQTSTAQNNSSQNQRQQVVQQVPQIPQRDYTQYPYNVAYGGYQAPIPQVNIPNNNENDEKPKEKENKWGASISFGTVGTQGSQNANGSAGTAQENSSGNGYNNGAATYTALAPNTLQAGTVIPAVLLSGINSDAGSGKVMAQVQQDIYDSLTGSVLLVPMGSRFIGICDADGSGNGRVSISWDTLILPDGGSYTLGENMIAMDGEGYSGIKGDVDSHTGKTLSAGVFSTALAALGSLAAGNTTASDTYSAGQIAAQGALSNLLNTASSMFNNSMNQTPTVTVEPGYQFNIFVCQNVTFGGAE